jgi:hypothetical protein
MKAQIESITPLFIADTAFAISLKSVPQRLENPEEVLRRQRFLTATAERFESRGVPESALHD